MTRNVKRSSAFTPGRGYASADWDAVDSPPLADAELAALRPARDALSAAAFEALTRRARGPQKAPTKVAVSLRLSPDVVAGFKAQGPGWQARMDAALRGALAKSQGRAKGR